MNDEIKGGDKLVKHFREILLWPLQLMPVTEEVPTQRHWQLLEQLRDENPWSQVTDDFGVDTTNFCESLYSEMVMFLPYVQRFLYSEGIGIETAAGYGQSPVRVFRRSDVARVCVTYHDQSEPAYFEVMDVNLYFFDDIDVVILVLEMGGDNLSLARAEDTMFRFGRAYPAFWDKNCQGGYCLNRVEWLSSSGDVLAVSDYEQRDKYLSFVSHHRAPKIASHWEYLLKPMVSHHSDQKGPIRYRQIEYYRMPLMSYLALDEPALLTRTDFIRLGLMTAPSDSSALPFSIETLKDFEARYCYDRYWEPNKDHSFSNTRMLCSGHAFSMIGNAKENFFTDPETGLLGQFRRQYFLLCLIAHFQKATLLMFSDRLVVAISKLDIDKIDSVKQFERDIHKIMDTFLRFSHRYWFHEVSNQIQARDLFKMWSNHLGTERLYAKVREEIKDMNDYLDSRRLKRQSDTVVRLTVVTVFGLMGTMATGFLGMNLFDEAENSWLSKILYFCIVFVPTLVLTLFTVAKSKALSEFLDAMSDERLSLRIKVGALFNIFKTKSKRSKVGAGRKLFVWLIALSGIAAGGYGAIIGQSTPGDFVAGLAIVALALAIAILIQRGGRNNC